MNLDGKLSIDGSKTKHAFTSFILVHSLSIGNWGIGVIYGGRILK